MVRRVVEAVLASAASPVLVVTEHVGEPVLGEPILLDEIGISHLSFSVPDLDGLTKRLLAAGVIVSYHDPLVPRVTLDGGRVLESTAPDAVGADIVIVHTLHRFLDLSWLPEGQLVLDATYRLGDRVNRVTL